MCSLSSVVFVNLSSIDGEPFWPFTWKSKAVSNVWGDDDDIYFHLLTLNIQEIFVRKNLELNLYLSEKRKPLFSLVKNDV